jgi:hypothetical protein
MLQLLLLFLLLLLLLLPTSSAAAPWRPYRSSGRWFSASSSPGT